ncbi:MAG: adenylosuccinate synthetase, partial [Pyrinomonadaceae bacterium]
AYDLRRVKPIYETLKGWKTDTSGITDFEKLPEDAKRYVNFLSDAIGVKIDLISTGAEREQTIILKNSVLESWLENHRKN